MYRRKFPIGAEVMPAGGGHFRVWAPNSERVFLELSRQQRMAPLQEIEMEREGRGYFSVELKEARAGMFYKFKLGSGSFPDPASRFQPQGPHGPSQIVDPDSFRWTDGGWKGVRRERQVIYEMHIGTFTREGTWGAAIEKLPELAELGITVLEVMPVADFPGAYGWGYDGVCLFAPTRLYGTADDFRRFVDKAHGLGLGVLLDVVYNHLGPDGNYLKEFAEHYFTDRYKNEWGQALNFDDGDSGPVREFFATNAAYWVDEFHLDGLRLDATQQIFDASPEHILKDIGRKVRQTAGKRRTYIVSENERQEARLVRSFEEGGYGLDALWNDDFHHSARVAATGHNEAYYSDYRGAPQEFISAAKRGYLYQGQWYSWQKKNRGSATAGLHPNQFVNFIENHDQVANSLHGKRLHELTSPGRLRALIALLLLGPGTPMLFQGQEFASSAPFSYFADHNPELAKLVAAGRKEFLRQFRTIACPDADPFVSDPGSEKTFLNSKLDWAERKKHASVVALHRDLLRLRREDPVLAEPYPGGVDGAVLSAHAFVLRFFGTKGSDRLLLINLGRDLRLTPIPEPLLAAPDGQVWEVGWSSESPCYSGCGNPPLGEDDVWLLPGEGAVFLASRKTAAMRKQGWNDGKPCPAD
ncbi:MAG TPA: malto-oligosyltrehalose trehalohydrolase [Candidatus Dormibacteraeota bacterium]|nr:malto-oligosyltrehalose trehalohydrolase [Candidatus Dormibacteraeota bacterium]